MKIAFIGTGRMAKALLQTFYKVYPADLILTGRDHSRTQKIIDELAPGATALAMDEAVQTADIIIPTLVRRYCTMGKIKKKNTGGKDPNRYYKSL